jgi:hypothetical protein
MADGPWRCSQCGTVNEPVANSCRTCGRWPSLFDLEESIVDEVAVEDAREPADAYFPEPAPVEAEAFEPEPVEPKQAHAEPYELEPELEAGPETEGSRRRRQLARFIVPVAIIVWIVISNILNR